MNFETIIGLECHVELKLIQMFSPSPAHSVGTKYKYKRDWLGYPGSSIVNKRALEFECVRLLRWTVRFQDTKFDRKTISTLITKAYQISQFDYPIGHDGWIDIEVEGQTKRIRIERVHLEEDAGKNTHGTDGFSYVDLNRQGTPLIEIVSEADMRSWRSMYLWSTSSNHHVYRCFDVKMEEGSMRCDANISIRPYGRKIRYKKQSWKLKLI